MRRGRSALVALAIAALVVVGPASHVDAAAYDRVRTCGTHLCIGDARWVMRIATIYGSLADPSPAIEMAKAAGANTIRITDFLTYGTNSAEAVETESSWQRVDNVIDLAAKSGMRVLLDLSPLRNLLLDEGVNPYLPDWVPYLTKAATRVNTITGVAYRDDPTIALVSIAGEVEPPNGGATPRLPTTRQVTQFFRSTLDTWSILAPKTLVNAGGLLHTDWDSGLDWRAIFALPGNDVCAIHLYNEQGLSKGLVPVADFCRKLGRPWIMEETGIPSQRGDAVRAQWFRDVLRASWRNGAAGVGVWNIGGDTVGPSGTTYDINPTQPLTWYAVQHGLSGHPSRRP
jgi:hypothetical protein